MAQSRGDLSMFASRLQAICKGRVRATPRQIGHPLTMRKVSVIALIAVSSIAVASASGTSQKQSLRVIDRDPLALRGEGFKPRERVRVTISAPVVERKLTRATRSGTFRVTFLEVSTTRCDMVRAVAVGGMGSRATVKYLPAPACAPMRTP
jgi:hypothetical protein